MSAGGACILISKIQYGLTSVPMTILATAAVLSPVANIVYAALVWPLSQAASTSNSSASTSSSVPNSTLNRVGQTTSDSNASSITTITFPKIIVALLLTAIVIIFITNVLHCIFSFATYRKDPSFCIYTAKHPVANRIIQMLALFTHHLCFTLYFCRLFNLSVFKATLSDVTVLNCLNYFWGISMVGSLIAIVAGLLAVIKVDDLILVGIDLIIINSLVLLIALMLFRKTRGSGWADDDFEAVEKSEDDLGSKKVMMEGDSHEHIEIDVETMEEINGKLKKNLISKEVAN